MKKTKSKKLTAKQRRNSELQVFEYIARYYPEQVDKVIVETSPCGT